RPISVENVTVISEVGHSELAPVQPRTLDELLLIITLEIIVFFFFSHPATTEIYTLSLHDALPILLCLPHAAGPDRNCQGGSFDRDRKSTRLNSSHVSISYAVFCLKKKPQLAAGSDKMP